MKPEKVLFFILGVFAVLGLGWALFPAEGISAGGLTVRLFSYRKDLARAQQRRIDVDSLLHAVDSSFAVREQDSLSYYRDFIRHNPNRIWMPADDWAFFDDVFADFEAAEERGIIYRIVHYGDSQIEMDRISSVLRRELQRVFGGAGTGMFPAMSSLSSGSVSHSASGGFRRYAMYGDSLTLQADHSRYGVMAQVVELNGRGMVRFRTLAGKRFSRVSLLAGNNPDTLHALLHADTLSFGEKAVPPDTLGVALVSWKLPKPLSEATLRLLGKAEIYGIAADGNGGVALDNVPLRGSAGTIFTRISRPLMRRSMELDGTRLILLQFGGNAMPGLSSSAGIQGYMRQIQSQLRYFREVAPQAKILFIGPADMGKSVDGDIVTWPLLPALVDSLRAVSLRNGAAFWDMYRMMGGENSMLRWVQHNPPYAGPDYIHFTPQGAQIVGEALSKSLLLYYDFYRLRRTLPEEEVKKWMEDE